MIWLYLSAVLMAATAMIHSVAGERKLIGPLTAPGANGTLSPGGRNVLRVAWHLTSFFMVSNALAVIWPRSPVGLIFVIGGFWLAVGLLSLVSSRGRHVGWPTLCGAGLAALIGAAG